MQRSRQRRCSSVSCMEGSRTQRLKQWWVSWRRKWEARVSSQRASSTRMSCAELTRTRGEEEDDEGEWGEWGE